VRELKARFPDDIGFEKIKRIERGDRIEVGDVALVEEEPAWLCQGVHVHNSGKTFASSIGMCRVLLELSCLRDPQKAFGLASDTPIVLAGLSANEELAKEVVLKNIVGKISASPYFRENFPFKVTQKNIRFPNNVLVVARATTPQSVLGMSILAALVDEGNFMPTRRKKMHERFGQTSIAKELFDSITRRIRSRYKRQGKLFLPSSKKTQDSFIQQRIMEAKVDPTIFVRDYCLSGDTVIPLLDGSSPTIEELATRYADSEERFEVYSFDRQSGRIVPGCAYRPRLTARNEETVLVGLDNGEEVRATPWHPFMLKDGSYKRADQLQEGDSLMPLHRRVNDKGYEELGQPWWAGRCQTTHHMSACYHFGSWPKRGKDGKPTIVHHRNFDKRDNRPGNLEVMEWTAHRKLHADNMTSLLAHVRSEKHRVWASGHMANLHKNPEFATARNRKGAAHLKALWDDPEWRAERSKAAGKRLSAFHRTKRGKEQQRLRNEKRWKGRRKTSLEAIFEAAKVGESITVLASRLGCCPAAVSQRLRRAGHPTYGQLKREAGHFSPNHKVVSVRSGPRCDVYDLSVEGFENFAVGAGVFVHNSLWDVKPGDYGEKTFWVLCGNEQIRSRILQDEEVGALQENLPERTVLVEVPEDCRSEFESDLEGCLVGETKIPLLTGEEVVIKDLVGRPEFGVYSYDEAGKLHPGRGFDARMTGRGVPVVDVLLDNEEVIRCTDNHPFMLRDGSYLPAKDLRPGCSLMPFQKSSGAPSPERAAVSVSLAGMADVYDITVEKWSNFALSSGVVVHNSIRDTAGIATVAISPFVQRLEKIHDMVDPDREHPFTQIVYDPSLGGEFMWDRMVKKVMVRERRGAPPTPKLIPRINPQALRHVHIDPALNNCSAGVVMAHIAGTQPVRRLASDLRRYEELAPHYVVDLVLEIVPPMNSDLDFELYRQLVYQLKEHGYPIVHVTMDQWQAIDGLQQLEKKGYSVDQVSMDKTWAPYQLVKAALYEDRISCYRYKPLLDELKGLEADWERRKINRPKNGSKDVADALAGCLFSLSQAKATSPTPFLKGLSTSDDPNTQAWMLEQSHAMMAGMEVDTQNMDLSAFTDPVVPFLTSGSGPGWENPF
jgi:hypothetical protein